MHWVNQFHVRPTIHGWYTYQKVNSCLALAQLIFSRSAFFALVSCVSIEKCQAKACHLQLNDSGTRPVLGSHYQATYSTASILI